MKLKYCRYLNPNPKANPYQNPNPEPNPNLYF